MGIGVVSKKNETSQYNLANKANKSFYYKLCVSDVGRETDNYLCIRVSSSFKLNFKYICLAHVRKSTMERKKNCKLSNHLEQCFPFKFSVAPSWHVFLLILNFLVENNVTKN